MTRLHTFEAWRTRMRETVTGMEEIIARGLEHGLPQVRRIRRTIECARLAGDLGACLRLRALLADLGYTSAGHRLTSHRAVADRDHAREDARTEHDDSGALGSTQPVGGPDAGVPR